MSTNNTGRFSNRVEDYAKFRPGYPISILNYLQDNFHLTRDKSIVDIGAGTGISSALFLEAGYAVRAVEPNREMREKSVELLGHYPRFTPIDARAEDTELPDTITDAIVSGQAFHWFDTAKSKKEFERILKPGGILALIWNERKTASPFELEYEELTVKHGKDYVKVDHRNISDQDIDKFFYPWTCTRKVFDNCQVFDFEGLKGRLLSSSYMPAKDQSGYGAMIDDLEKLFEKYKEDNRIRINYDTKLYAGTFK
jgi:SAM-dependent methyltransferase